MITSEILKDIGVLSVSPKGYSKKVKLISWNGNEAKIDVREWHPDEKCGKGVTLTADEAKKLIEVLQNYFVEEPDNENNKEKNI